MASRKLFTEESRELTDIVVSENDKTTQHRKVGYWALVAVVGVLAVSCLGVALKFSVPMTSIKRAIPISLSNSLERELAPKCKDFPELQILEVTHNNLGKQGPDTGEEGLIYHVRSSRGNDFEMVVNALGTFYCPLPKFNGMHGPYATVNVASLNSAKLRFSFRDWKTKQQVTMDDFTLTFFDLDHGYGNGGVEEIKFEGDWVQAVVAEDTSILVHELEGDTGAIHFKSTEESLKPDEPKNPKVLTQRQFNKAVSLKFRKSHSFIVTLMVTTKSPSPRFFSFVGEAAILCARDFQGVKLPVGEVYFNPKALEKDLETAGAPMWSTFLGFLGAGLGLMVLVALAGLLYVCMNSVPQGYVQMAFEEEKQGPGLFWVTIPAGAGVRLGLLLDAPDGINQPPMIKEVLAGGAVQRYNNSKPPLALEPYDAIITFGDVSDPAGVVESLYGDLPEELILQLDRPQRLRLKLQGSLGARLDALEDSMGAVIMEIFPDGPLAQWNSQNLKQAVNKGDRIIELRGTDFSARNGWKLRSPSGQGSNPFGSRSNSRFLEEIEAHKDMDIDVTVLRYESSESKV